MLTAEIAPTASRLVATHRRQGHEVRLAGRPSSPTRLSSLVFPPANDRDSCARARQPIGPEREIANKPFGRKACPYFTLQLPERSDHEPRTKTRLTGTGDFRPATLDPSEVDLLSIK